MLLKEFMTFCLRKILLFSLVTICCLAVSATPVWAAANPGPSSFRQGIEALIAQRYPQAIAAFTEVIEQNTHLAAAYGNRCLAYLSLDQYPQAIADCTQALEHQPNSAEFYLNRGLARYRLGEYAPAIADYTQALSFKPDDYRAFYNRGLAQFGLTNYSAAIADYNQSLQVSPPLAAARLAAIYDARGVAYLQQQESTAAKQDFIQAIQYNAADTRALFNLACACHQQGHELAAIAYFDQVLELAPKHAQTYLNRAMIYQQIGNHPQAIADLNQAADCFYQQGRQAAYRQVMQILTRLQAQPAVFG